MMRAGGRERHSLLLPFAIRNRSNAGIGGGDGDGAERRFGAHCMIS
ncbi:hypothetical protein ILFOPFJJ_03687 [Ensifer psoraleae]|nr:hypothetical protein [Sinorhizobium psoraleae]